MTFTRTTYPLNQRSPAYEYYHHFPPQHSHIKQQLPSLFIVHRQHYRHHVGAVFQRRSSIWPHRQVSCQRSSTPPRRHGGEGQSDFAGFSIQGSSYPPKHGWSVAASSSHIPTNTSRDRHATQGVNGRAEGSLRGVEQVRWHSRRYAISRLACFLPSGEL